MPEKVQGDKINNTSPHFPNKPSSREALNPLFCSPKQKKGKHNPRSLRHGLEHTTEPTHQTRAEGGKRRNRHHIHHTPRPHIPNNTSSIARITKSHSFYCSLHSSRLKRKNSEWCVGWTQGTEPALRGCWLREEDQSADFCDAGRDFD